MEKQEVTTRVEKIFYALFGEELPFNEEFSASDVLLWDSLHHVIFISKVEEEFIIKFELDEMLDIKTISDIIRFVLKKVSV